MHKLLTPFAAGAALLLGACASTDTLQPVPADRTFVNFSGVCHGSVNSAPLWGTALGWDRFDFSWQSFQPQRGKWNNAYLEKYCQRILAAKAKGVKFLPILDYGNGWTADGIPEQEFELGGRVYTVNRRPDGDFDVAGYNKETVNGVVRPTLYLNDKMTNLLENGGAATYVQGLQAKGIKVVLTVLGEGENGFLYVQWGGYTGYVSGDYVTPFGAQ